MYLYEFRNADKNISACYTGGDGAAELLNAYGNDWMHEWMNKWIDERMKSARVAA